MKPTLLAILAHPDDESFGIGGTLARYARENVDVHVAIATDGIAGSVAEGFQVAKEQLGQVRTKEVRAATQLLGVTLHMLGYRDSGYVGDPANDHSDAFIHADEYEAIGRIVKLIREIRPQVVITHDEMGGYFHPDHIFCCKITTEAFYAAGDSDQYSELELEAFQPERLYYTAFPNRWVKLITFLMRLWGQDPTRIGRNQDIDLTRLGVPPEKITTQIDFRRYWDVKVAAGAQHPSQGGGAGIPRLIPLWLQKRLLAKESYMRAYPPVSSGYRETDLFARIRSPA
jgi:mycothiol S-conjugate amidase